MTRVWRTCHSDKLTLAPQNLRYHFPMGAIFGSDKDFSPNFVFDLTSQPTANEKGVYDQLQVVIDNHTKIIDQMKAYKGKK